MKSIEVLKKPFLFSTMLEDELQTVADIATEREYSPGENVFAQGEAAFSMFIITGGTVDILKKGADGKEALVGTMSAGSPLGEMAFVDLSPRAATARARDRLWLLEIAYSEMEALFASRPEIGVKFYRALVSVLCKRIR